MKIHPRYYPVILITTYVLFLLLGILLGFGPERGSESGSHDLLFLLEACA